MHHQQQPLKYRCHRHKPKHHARHHPYTTTTPSKYVEDTRQALAGLKLHNSLCCSCAFRQPHRSKWCVSTCTVRLIHTTSTPGATQVLASTNDLRKGPSSDKIQVCGMFKTYAIWLFNIAMENHHF